MTPNYAGRPCLPINAVFLAIGYHLFVRFYEEPTLKRLFGEEYVRYTEAVPRWLPKRRSTSCSNHDNTAKPENVVRLGAKFVAFLLVAGGVLGILASVQMAVHFAHEDTLCGLRLYTAYFFTPISVPVAVKRSFKRAEQNGAANRSQPVASRIL